MVPRRSLVVSLVALASACFPAAAGADIYWVAGAAGDRIARAGNNGRALNTRFISGLREVGSLALGGGYLYWTSGTAIGRARMDGTGVDRTFIRGVGAVSGVAVDTRFVYWVSDVDPACGGKPGFGRAQLNGSHIERGFVCSAKHRSPVAVDGYANGIGIDGSHLYWGWFGGIGRVTTNGTGIYDNNFIKIPSGDSAAGVTVNGSHIYWGSYSPGPPIGRANVTGTGVKPAFIGGVSGDIGPEVAVTSRYLYFTNDYFDGTTVARASLQGVVSWDFISGLDAVGDLVVGPGG